jgi:hypothetical protein
MNRFTPFLAVLGLAAGSASAQPPGPPPGGAFDIERLAVLLDLDAYQKGEVERIFKEQRDARVAEREQRAATDERPSPEEFRARREQDREALFGKLQNTLTQQQIEKLKLLTEPPQGPRGGRRGGPGAGPF